MAQPAPVPITDKFDGYLNGISDGFNDGVKQLNEQLQNALDTLETNPSDPKYLADYQALMSEYNLYRNAQSSSVKAMKDIDSAIVSNFR